jgi:hypothetical protein
MKKREKILAGVIFGFIVVFVIGIGLRSFFLKPLKEIDKQTALLREKIGKINQERREYFEAEDALKKVTQRTFSVDLNQASARSGEIMTREIAAAGLNDADFTRLPVGPRKLKGASEIGWSIQGKGDLTRIVNLMFLLQTSPHLHRIEGVTLSASEKPGEVKARFLYLTLVIEPAPEFDPIEIKRQFTLESPERFAYSTIVARDLLRPYIKAPPKHQEPGSPDSTRPAGPESLRIVSLSEWNGHPEVHIRDLVNQKTLRFAPGDKLDDTTEVVAIDYTPLPSTRNPLLTADSRVILRVAGEYWFVERGRTLAEKQKCEPAQLPRTALEKTGP